MCFRFGWEQRESQESLWTKKTAGERRESIEWEVAWDLEIRWRRETWTKGRTPLPATEEKGRCGYL